MAATDKPFNNQRTLDIVFAVSNILMLLSVVWMMVQDYRREYKTEQRAFREVESTLAVRLALEQLPDPDDFDKAEKAVMDTRPSDEDKNKVTEAKRELGRLQPLKEKAEAKFQAVQAEVSSKTSFRYIALEHAETPEKTKEVTAQYDKILADLDNQLATAQAERDAIASQMKAAQLTIETIDAPHTKALGEFKKVNDKVDSQIKLAIAKRWGFGDWLRTQPVINGFADPLKIHQFTINDIPIDYNFKQVTRFDRCMSCHVGISDARFSKDNLEKLTTDDPHAEKLKKARDFYDRRVKALGNSPDVAMIPNPYRVESTKLSESLLTKSRISEFAAHPRLDLFVGASSKHPAEKFGCTACHSGQGSGTSFNDASHSPNSMSARKDWTAKNGWEFNHMWDFPMHSKRFVESSCLKCHHEVTDLVGRDGKIEAPKLMRGFNLIKENGCFGCHEISGWKSGQRIGPDLRAEPSPPIEDLLPSEQERVKNDTDNRPGTLRKVGPSLARVKEKVSTAWIEKWLASPSSFRPDTKMPHYYGLSTNNVDSLPDDQKKFPDTEMASIAHFLTKTSENYLADAATVRKDSDDIRRAEKDELTGLITRGRLDEKEQARFNELKWKRQLRKVAPLEDLAKDYKGDKDKGRNLFIERGCLACHTHQGTEKAGKNSPSITSEAMFGPNLTQIAEKFDNEANGRKWLVQWIMNPQLHSPRSRMPVTHLEPKEAADIAAWLLAQSSGRDADDPWHKITVKQPTKQELQDLVRVYLVRMLSKRDVESYLKGEIKDGADWDVVKSDLTKDEIALRDKVNSEDDLKFYLGKKAVTRLGCFGCHDIPGFENTKSIGVGLNDWGKKPADRLAFEDIDNFFKKHYHTVDSLVDDNGKPVAAKDKDGKEPYESFYTEALTGHHRQRDGYLNQKIRDPRSYDYNRLRTWDDRARMPKFTFARPRKKDGETEDAFKARVMKEEAEAREAVATFVLGLTSEQVPTKSINQPTGDRMDEVKGRQILDKYNCASCHMIRPGVYDFKASPNLLQALDGKYDGITDLIKNEIIHPNHHNWVGRNPLGADPMTAFGVPKFDEGELALTLSEAFRFTGKGKAIRNIPAGFDLRIPIEDVGSGGASIKSQADFDQRFQANAPYGGTFADLMVPWLTSKGQPAEYKAKYKEERDARHALPPTLFGQGERTQTDWLNKFLLDPQRVRQLTILRMPKFNMSDDEAKALVKYFAAVTRLNNPGIGLTYPYEVIPARDELSSKYWRDKTADYVKRLHAEKDKDGKPLFDTRLAGYQKAWEKIRADEEPRLKTSLTETNARIVAKTKEKQAAEKKKADEKDAAKKAELDKEIGALDIVLAGATQRKADLERDIAGLDEKAQEKQWTTEEAYAADAYRLLTSRELCAKCHQIGTMKAIEPNSQGPALDQAFARLRPGWVERWIDQPQRFLPYASVMPVYFERGQAKHQNLHAGPAREQIEALRDVLMNFERVSRLSINKTQDPDQPAGK